MLMLQQIHEPRAFGTDIYSTTVDVSSFILVLSGMRGDNLFQMSGPFHGHGSLKQQSNCINKCHSILLGGSFKPLSNIISEILCFPSINSVIDVLLNIMYDSIFPNLCLQKCAACFNCARINLLTHVNTHKTHNHTHTYIHTHKHTHIYIYMYIYIYYPDCTVMTKSTCKTKYHSMLTC